MDRHPRGGNGDPGAGSGRWPFTLEKRYFDVLTQDGTLLIVHVAWMRLAGARVGRVIADLLRPRALRLGGVARAGRADEEGGRMSCGAAVLEGNVLAFETPGLSGEIHYAPRHPPVALGAPLLRDGGRRLDWTVDVPDADAEGTLWWPGGSMEIAGRGYADRVWTDLLPWRSPIRELRWGRIAAEEHASVWVQARTRHGEVAAGWADGARAEPRDCHGEVDPGRLVLDGPAAELEDLRLGALRPLLRRLLRDPEEKKWVSTAALRGSRGVAVREHVRWR